MTCADARNIILSAGPDALRDRTDPVLRQHLEGCADCAVAAGHVVADMARLRHALAARAARMPAARTRREPRRVAMTLVPVALAAELALFAFMGTKDNPNPFNQRIVIDDTITSMLPGHTGIQPGEVTISVAPVPVVDARKPDSASRRDSLAKIGDSVTALLRRVMPTASPQFDAFAVAGSGSVTIWRQRVDTL